MKNIRKTYEDEMCTIPVGGHTYGPDLVESGRDFSDPAWFVGDPGLWDGLDGNGACKKSGTSDSLTQEIVSELAGLTYRIVVVTGGIVSGSVLVSFGDTNMGPIAADGTYEFIITTLTDTDFIALTPDDSFEGCILEVKIQLQLT